MSGLTKASLMLSSTGKVVSKKQNAQGKKAYKHIAAWTKALREDGPGQGALREGKDHLPAVSRSLIRQAPKLQCG